MKHRVALLALFSVAAIAAELQPYEMKWRAEEGVLVDLSFLLDAPAGGAGFVAAKDGRLYDGSGKRLRIWGVNFSFTASVPAKEEAAAVAAHLARFGINCVRVHHLDWRTPQGIIDSRHPDSRHLDDAVLDRLDFFVSELKKRGIYTNLNLNVARAFQEADGVKDADQLGFAKAMTFFDPRMIELQKEYARTLLTHRNPYTGNEYRREPAVAIVEIVNENSVIESWKAGRLQGKGPAKNADKTWSDIPASYAADLTALYNKWLKANLSKADLAAIRQEAGVDGEVPRLRPDQFKAASDLRFRTETAFYMNVENRFFEDMYGFLRRDIGVKMPVTGTSVHNGGITPYPLLTSTAKLDIVDAHTYWQHPKYLSDPETGRRTGYQIDNSPSVNEPGRSAVVTLSRSAIAGKPFMVSEVNHPYPNEYAAEGIPLLAAYGALQDWDAIFWYSFEHGPAETWDSPKLPGNFDMRQDPMKMTQWAAGALTFLRGDVATAKKLVTRNYTRQQVLEGLRLPGGEQPYFTPGFPAELALVHRVRVGSFEALGYVNPARPDALVSDTGELRWSGHETRQGVVTVNSPRTQAIVGHLKQGATTAAMTLEATTPFGAATLVSLEERPIAQASRLLLSAAVRSANRGIVWDEKRQVVSDGGQPGMMIEPLNGVLTLRGLDGARAVALIPLDGGGTALGAELKAERAGDGWRVKLGTPATPWYVVRVERSGAATD